ncbi:21769_t:CDS:2, partial [Entrophospora sp. SA101]
KIRRLKIPAMCLDSGAEPAIVSEDIVKRVNWPIDKSEKYDLKVDSNEGGNEPLEEEWHAPADFSLDSDNSTLKKNAMNLKN